MNQSRYHFQQNRGVGFLGNYLPRECGIATFTHDLANAISKQIDPQQVVVAAMNDISEGYSYPGAVAFEVRQDQPRDYVNAADYFNYSHVDVVSIQHEYGIFGGEWGSNLLAFVKALKKPSVMTCHTVFEKPEETPREIVRELASHVGKLVVMSQRAVHFLETAYDIPSHKICCIPHGIHDMPFIDPSYFKDKFNVEGKRVMLTFGLLRREKGLEYVIEALPDIVRAHPDVAYIILGATHPAVVRQEGESYRLGLQRRARELGVEKNVHFHPHFVDLDGLLEYIGAADIFVTPYIFMEQITSGALSYAMGVGKAVVSTPYWHAEELLADGRGVLVPPKDAGAISTAINDLLGSEKRLSAMRKRAYLHCRDMVWSSVAGKYLQLFEELRNRTPERRAIRSNVHVDISPANLPVPSLDHLLRMSDDTGPARFARYSIPEWKFGYTLEDACSIMVVANRFFKYFKEPQAVALLQTSVGLVQYLVDDKEFGGIGAGLDYARHDQGVASEEHAAQVLWALGDLVKNDPGQFAAYATDQFAQVIPKTTCASLRAKAYVVMGTSGYLQESPGATFVKRCHNEHLDAIITELQEDDWITKWAEADWPLAIYTLATALQLSARKDDSFDGGLIERLVDSLLEETEFGTVFLLPGQVTDNAEFSVTAATFISACASYFSLTRNERVLKPIRAAMDWFLGSNRHNVAVYDFVSKGCHDALGPSGLNSNQSTAATVHFLLALVSLHEIDRLRDTHDVERDVQ